MKNPILPESVHVNLTKLNGWDYRDIETYSYTSKIVPSIWLKFNGQGKWDEWTWNEKYEKDIKEKIGDFYDSRIKVVEWNIIRDIAYLMKSAKEIGFDANSYYTQFEDNDIMYFDSVDIKIN